MLHIIPLYTACHSDNLLLERRDLADELIPLKQDIIVLGIEFS
jgi:hypothetical protein